MPCRNDYTEQSGQQLESIRVCTNLCYLFRMIGKRPPDWVIATTNNYYGNVARLDEATKILCSTIRSLTDEELEKYVYDGHSAEARKLAGWWDRHQEWDARRIKEEEEERKRQETRAAAIKKLSTEELLALGLIDTNG